MSKERTTKTLIFVKFLKCTYHHVKITYWGCKYLFVYHYFSSIKLQVQGNQIKLSVKPSIFGRSRLGIAFSETPVEFFCRFLKVSVLKLRKESMGVEIKPDHYIC